MKILVTNPDSIGDFVLRQPMFDALAEAGHEVTATADGSQGLAALDEEADRFDLVISEYGASLWADPYAWVPECARVLRPGGRLVFLGWELISSGGTAARISSAGLPVTDVADLPNIVHEAFHVAATGRPGPVLIDVPKDVLNAETEWVDPISSRPCSGWCWR